jgi:hypothetical protein
MCRRKRARTSARTFRLDCNFCKTYIMMIVPTELSAQVAAGALMAELGVRTVGDVRLLWAEEWSNPRPRRHGGVQVFCVTPLAASPDPSPVRKSRSKISLGNCDTNSV